MQLINLMMSIALKIYISDRKPRNFQKFYKF